MSFSLSGLFLGQSRKKVLSVITQEIVSAESFTFSKSVIKFFWEANQIQSSVLIAFWERLPGVFSVRRKKLDFGLLEENLEEVLFFWLRVQDV